MPFLVFVDTVICMTGKTSKTDQDGTQTSRRQVVLRVAQAAAGIAASNVGAAWAQKQNKAKPSTPAAFPKPEKRSITIATTNLSALPYLPLLVAQQKGFFAQHGLELQISEQQSAARATAALASGSADMVCGWLENMLAAPGRALALQSFVLLGVSPMMALGVPMRPAPASDAPSARRAQSNAPTQPTQLFQLTQLRGRKIGVVALNSPTHTVALAALRRAGLRASEVGFVSVGSPASAAMALRSGQIDALVHMDPLMLQLEQSGEIDLLASMRSPAACIQALGVQLPSSCVAAPAEFLLRYPGTAQACSDALVQALQWLAQASLRDMLNLLPDKSSSAEGLANSLSMDAQLFLASFERLRSAYSADGVCTLPLASNLLQAMVDAEPAMRLEQIDVQRSINNAFALRSLVRLKS